MTVMRRASSISHCLRSGLGGRSMISTQPPIPISNCLGSGCAWRFEIPFQKFPRRISTGQVPIHFSWQSETQPTSRFGRKTVLRVPDRKGTFVPTSILEVRIVALEPAIRGVIDGTLHGDRPARTELRSLHQPSAESAGDRKHPRELHESIHGPQRLIIGAASRSVHSGDVPRPVRYQSPF